VSQFLRRAGGARTHQRVIVIVLIIAEKPVKLQHSEQPPEECFVQEYLEGFALCSGKVALGLVPGEKM
jgi:hypothetical protein